MVTWESLLLRRETPSSEGFGKIQALPLESGGWSTSKRTHLDVIYCFASAPGRPWPLSRYQNVGRNSRHRWPNMNYLNHFSRIVNQPFLGSCWTQQWPPQPPATPRCNTQVVLSRTLPAIRCIDPQTFRTWLWMPKSPIKDSKIQNMAILRGNMMTVHWKCRYPMFRHVFDVYLMTNNVLKWPIWQYGLVCFWPMSGHNDCVRVQEWVSRSKRKNDYHW